MKAIIIAISSVYCSVAIFINTTTFPAITRTSTSPIRIKAGVFHWYREKPRLREAYRDNARRYASRANAANETVCKVDLFFFAGRHHLDITPSKEFVSENGTNADMFKGNVDEGHGGGKLFSMLDFVEENWPEYDYLIKMDLDVAVDWHFLCQNLGNLTRSDNIYFGRSNRLNCGPYGHCPPTMCLDFDKDCWMFHSGGLVGLSKPLVSKLHVLPNMTREGMHDWMLGQWVKEVSKNHEITVVHYQNGYAWCHFKPIDFAFMSGRRSIREKSECSK